ncbi:VTT domain-containing protein [Luteolibacter flavescens]|uniref:VTT domain-containing protein n=1 Tax=Luteolibacter flavescens TaxID=1859460 RepID=A0ABT3FU02_9BACT|nr:VTT domain-containing protein [Luteolibacter flavescens]MCW1886912.1 VTT domain-containing protein [Luteolibacter flavescens]
MRLVIWFIAISAVILLGWVLWGGSWEESFSLAGSVAWLERAGPWAWAAGIWLLAADLVLPVPGTVVMSALGYVYGLALGGLVAAAGSMTAGLCGYGVGRLVGERAARKLLGDRDFEKGRLLFARGGGWMIALSRSLPILPEAISCTAGLVRMPFGRFVASLACGSLPVGYLFAWIGAAGREAPGWALVFSLLVPAVLWLAARKVIQ